MAAGERTIRVRFTGDNTSLRSAARGGSAAVNSWTNSFKGFVAAIGAFQVARKLFDFARDSVNEFKAAQQAQEQLSDAFSRFPKLANTNIEALRQLDSELERKTRFDDDALASGQAILAQFKLTGLQVKNLTPLLADYAAKTGKDIPTAAELLGKAFLGNTRALKEIGVNYKATGNYAKDVANITELVRQKVGGFAEKEGKNASGQAEILSNQFGELKENLGGKLLPVLLTLTTIGLQVVDWLGQNMDLMGPLIGAVAAVTAAQWLWNAAMAANPIGLAVIGIAALVTGIAIIATKTRFFQTVWNAVWGAIKGTGIAVFNAIAGAWNNTVGRLDFTVPGWIPLIGGKHFAVPHIPTFHTGGIMPGVGDQLAVVRGGEGVFTPEQMAALGGMIGERNVEVRVYVGERELTDIVRTEVVEMHRGTRRWVAANRGAAA